MKLWPADTIDRYSTRHAASDTRGTRNAATAKMAPAMETAAIMSSLESSQSRVGTRRNALAPNASRAAFRKSPTGSRPPDPISPFACIPKETNAIR